MQMAGETLSPMTACNRFSSVSYPSISSSLASFAWSVGLLIISSSLPAPEHSGGGGQGGAEKTPRGSRGGVPGVKPEVQGTDMVVRFDEADALCSKPAQCSARWGVPRMK